MEGVGRGTEGGRYGRNWVSGCFQGAYVSFYLNMGLGGDSRGKNFMFGQLRRGYVCPENSALLVLVQLEYCQCPFGWFSKVNFDGVVRLKSSKYIIYVG